MNARKREIANPNKLAIDRQELAQMLSVGVKTADKIGTECGAKFRLGTRVLYRTDRVRSYLDTLTADAK